MEHSIDELPDDDHPLFGADAPAESDHYVPGRQSRTDRHRRRPRRHRTLAPILAILVILAVVAGGWIAVNNLKSRFAVADYSGAGDKFVRIQVVSGQGASDIAVTLKNQGVVKSTQAFINAAKKSGRAADIQPGTYQVRLHSSGTAAMTAILDPKNLIVQQFVIPEGFTYLQAFAAISKATGISTAALQTAAKDLSGLGIPSDLQVSSVEGLLFPATYQYSDNTTASTALQSMVDKFSAEYVQLGVADKAKALNLSPYKVLIIASIAEAEAKFDADRAKVARVIMNRIAAGRPLQVDATSAYWAKLNGKDPAKVVYASIPGPYNSYKNAGLPPTPIGNPGVAAISGALNPPAGSWMYYVNIDAAGHLGFFTDEAQFLAAADKCKKQGWGCG
ncbi:endolytic transglycosylase MltG [Jatrophihabitans telluris]|uniref:Endolytic murein transglycosylase n=1 Tax=Jatrophihabitans telluris TaxID=2038343 RepID=A0ABY4QSG2_9ACTN|nr:endolytic transglycosylase MltG [Jatrophihabitans telluris]UQX86786.1 endolytic transglycosylase MltG [Jatrophihabitans telluris]